MSWPALKQAIKPVDFHDYVMALRQGIWKPSLVVLHNTAQPTFADWHKTPGQQRMDNLEYYYQKQLGWSGGPHLFVADDYIWTFNDLLQPGVHSPSWNHLSWGVEVVGDYSVEKLTSEVEANIITVLRSLFERAGLTSEALRMHHEDPLTTHKGCPGQNIVKSFLQEEIGINA